MRGLLAGVGFFGGGAVALFIWGRQLYQYARTGAAESFSLVDLLFWFYQSEWLYWPTDWLGIHNAMSWLNGGFAALAIGWMFAWVVIVTEPGS